MRGQSALPALPATVAAYLADRADQGASISTVRADAAGIAAAHRAAGHDTPTATEGVRATLRGLARQRAGHKRRQAGALTDSALAAIRATACQPRRGRGGALEIPANAEERGKVDIGLCALASDAGLRRAELAELAWDDIETWEDGSGRLTVRHSKTDQEGEGAVVYLSPQTMRDLEAIRPDGQDGTEPVFSLGPAQLSRRIAAAARAGGPRRGLQRPLRQGRPRPPHDRQGSPNSGRDATRPMGQPRNGRQLHPRRDRRPGRPIPHMNRPTPIAPPPPDPPDSPLSPIPQRAPTMRSHAREPQPRPDIALWSCS